MTPGRKRRLRKRERQNRWVKAQRLRVPLESALEARVVAYAETGLRVWMPKVGLRGWPDRLVVLGLGQHCWFEFKRRKFGSLTPAQRRRIPELRGAGERVYVLKDFDEAAATLRLEVNAVRKEERT